jgi:hypothetical protein
MLRVTASCVPIANSDRRLSPFGRKRTTRLSAPPRARVRTLLFLEPKRIILEAAAMTCRP